MTVLHLFRTRIEDFQKLSVILLLFFMSLTNFTLNQDETFTELECANYTNFTTKVLWLLKAGSILTPLPHHSEISQVHTTDHETALSHQPGLSDCCLHCSPVSFIVQSIFFFKFIDLNRNYLHLMYHIFYIIYSELLLYGLSLCQEALSVLLY